MKPKVKRISERTLACLMSALLIIQAVYMPSATVFADDVTVPSIGGDTSYMYPSVTQKTVDISFAHEDGNALMVFSDSDGNSQTVSLPHKDDSEINPTHEVSALGVKIKWKAYHAYDNNGTITGANMYVDGGNLYVESTNWTTNHSMASDVHIDLEFDDTDNILMDENI